MMDNKYNSVFNKQRYTYHRWWNIPGHIKMLYDMLKAMYQRGRYGFAPADVWNLSDFISKLMHDSLIYLRDNNVGHPVDMTEEQWKTYLGEMAYLFDFIIDEEDEESEKYLENWCELKEKYGKEDINTITEWERYVDANKRFTKERIEKKDRAFNMLKKRFFDLWD